MQDKIGRFFRSGLCSLKYSTYHHRLRHLKWKSSSILFVVDKTKWNSNLVMSCCMYCVEAGSQLCMTMHINHFIHKHRSALRKRWNDVGWVFTSLYVVNTLIVSGYMLLRISVVHYEFLAQIFLAAAWP